jgi:hypothetical protein
MKLFSTRKAMKRDARSDIDSSSFMALFVVTLTLTQTLILSLLLLLFLMISIHSARLPSSLDNLIFVPSFSFRLFFFASVVRNSKMAVVLPKNDLHV